MQSLDLAALAPFLGSSPVTLLAAVVWWEIRAVRQHVQAMGERIAALEASVLK